MPTYRIVLAGSPPRTKKNSPQIIPGMKHARLVPSEAYSQWLKDVLTLKPVIHRTIPGLPLSGDVGICATVYREAFVGDWTGYVDAIADAIQSDVWQCQREGCRAKTVADRGPIACSKCGDMARMKNVRRGLGIIVDDKQIQHWDGTRLAKDAMRPRIELVITTIEAQEVLFKP